MIFYGDAPYPNVISTNQIISYYVNELILITFTFTQRSSWSGLTVLNTGVNMSTSILPNVIISERRVSVHIGVESSGDRGDANRARLSHVLPK